MSRRIIVVTEHPEYQLLWYALLLAAIGTVILCVAPLAFMGGGIYLLYAITLPSETPDKGYKIAISLIVIIVSGVISCMAGSTLIYQCLYGNLCI